MKKHLSNQWKAGVVSLVAGTALVVGLAASRDANRTSSAKSNPPTSMERMVSDQGSFVPVVKKITPSVVKVFTEIKAKTTMMPAPDMPMFRWFFDPSDMPDGPHSFRMPPQQGAGSGVIVSKEGYILTNNHVVDGADRVKVTLHDGREYDGKVVGTDPQTDLAVLKVDAKDLPAAEMADSDEVQPGAIVLAIGNPFGIGQTVTMGIVSATGRATLGLDYEDFIQTDAAINPGNSGGALVDAQGRLVGINTAILSRTGGNQGIGFAIPTNLARFVMDNLIKDGKVTRGYLGVMVQDVTPALAREFKLKDTHGALVGDVLPEGPAEKAGIQNGDVLLTFNGKPVTDSRHLRLAVARVEPGKTVPISLVRSGSTKNLKVTLSKLSSPERLAQNDRQAEPDTGTLNGVTVADLNPRTRKEFNVPENIHGALVTDVRDDSAAREAGLNPGDVILEINQQSVQNAEDAVQLTENAKDKQTLLRIWSRGGKHYVVVDERSMS